MSCEEGYSVVNETNNTCVRDCAEGYYPDGEICWPICPAGSVDIGPSCIKTVVQRLPLLWTTATRSTNVDYPSDDTRRNYTLISGSNGYQTQAINGSNSAGCPPYYSNYVSSPSDLQPDYYAIGTPQTLTTKCFIACPVVVAGSGLTAADQTILDSTGSCKSTTTGIDEYANLFNYPPTGGITSPYNSDYNFLSLTTAQETAIQRYPTSGVSSAYQAITNETANTNLAIYADRGSTASGAGNAQGIIQRTYSLPICADGQRAQFFATSTSTGEYIDALGIKGAGGSSTPTNQGATLTQKPVRTALTPSKYIKANGDEVAMTTTNMGTTNAKNSVTGTSKSPGLYQNFFLCKNICPGTTKRYSDYCMEDCPVIDLASAVATAGTSATYQGLIYPAEDAPQRRCMLNETGSSVEVSYTSSLPAGITNKSGSCPANTLEAKRWKKNSTYVNPQLYSLDTDISGIVTSNSACVDQSSTGVCPIKIKYSNTDVSQVTLSATLQTFTATSVTPATAQAFKDGSTVYGYFNARSNFSGTSLGSLTTGSGNIKINIVEFVNPIPTRSSSSSSVTITSSNSPAQNISFVVSTTYLDPQPPQGFASYSGNALNPILVYSDASFSALVATGTFVSLDTIAGSTTTKTLNVLITIPPATTTTASSWYISQSSALPPTNGGWEFVQRYNAAGFLDTGTKIQVICTPLSPAETSALTIDSTYSNISLRAATFTDPETSLPSKCTTAGHSLLGESANLQDTSFSLGGYKTELFPEVGRVISAATNVFSPYSYYNYGDVISMGVDSIEIYKGKIYSKSVPWQNGVDDVLLKTFKNETYGNLMGPFFKCIKAFVPSPTLLISPTNMTVGLQYVIAKYTSLDFTAHGSPFSIVGTVFKATSVPTTAYTTDVEAVMRCYDARTLFTTVASVLTPSVINSVTVANGDLFSVMDPGSGFNWALIGCIPNPVIGTIFRLNFSASYDLPNPIGTFLTGWVIPCNLPKSGASIAATQIKQGFLYQILTAGTTNFTLIGSSNSTVGTQFIASANASSISAITGTTGTAKLIVVPRTKYLSDGQLESGKTYVISFLGTTLWTLFGALENKLGHVFIAALPNTMPESGTGLVLPSADYDYSSFFKQDVNFSGVSNEYWTSAQIPTRKLIENMRLAGVDDFQNAVCQELVKSDGTSNSPLEYAFCPPMCTNSCAYAGKALTSSGATFGDPVYIEGNVLQTLISTNETPVLGSGYSKQGFATFSKNTSYTFAIVMEGTIKKFSVSAGYNTLICYWQTVSNRVKRYLPIFTGTVTFSNSSTLTVSITKLHSSEYTLVPSLSTLNDDLAGPVVTPSSSTGGQWYFYGYGPAHTSYVGYREPTFDYGTTSTSALIKTPITDSHCYFRCGSSGSWTSNGRFCISQSVPETLDPDFPEVLDGFSWCPAPNHQIDFTPIATTSAEQGKTYSIVTRGSNPLFTSLGSSSNAIGTLFLANANGSSVPLSTGTVKEIQNPAKTVGSINYIAGQYEIGDPYSTVLNVKPTESEDNKPTDRKCLTSCPEGYYSTNETPYDKCFTRCPANSAFQDTSIKCVKIPYTRQVYGGTALSQTPEQQLQSVETNFSPAAAKGSKIALGNGPSALLKWISYAVILSVIIILVMFVYKYNQAKQ